MAGDICKQLAGMPLLQDIPVVLCSLENLSKLCREKFALVFVDKYFDQTCIAEICSTIRFNSSPPNKSVAIIGVDTCQDQNSTSCMALTEVISLPLREEVINQLLLRYAGIIPYRDLPLTPDEDVAVARKAAEIIRQSEEQSFLSEEIESTFNSHQNIIPCTTQNSRFGSGLLTDSNSIQFIRADPPDQYSLRQSSLTDNTEMRLNVKESTESVSYQDPMSNKEHTSWTISHNQISENISQNVLPIPVTYTDHLNGTQTNQEYRGQNNSLGACQPSHRIPVSNQSCLYEHFPFPIEQESKTQQIANSNHTTIQNQLPGPGQSNVPSQVHHTCSTEAEPSRMKVETSAGRSAYMVSGTPGSKDMKITILPDDMSKHSSKERVRRERIKDSCDKLRCLLPNIAGKKTDMASILEMTVKFVKLVNERTPPQVIQEIAVALSASTMGMCRKRTQKENPTSKQKLMRVVHSQTPVSVPSPLISGDSQGHIMYPSYMSNNNVGIFHPHSQHFGSNTLQYNQYIQGMNCGGTYSPLTKDMHASFIHPTHMHGINQGISSISKDIPNVPTHAVKDSQMCHNYQSIHSDICHHRQMYGPALTVNTSSPHNDMPQQWSFLKLPPISAISPGSNSCLSSSEDQDSRSNSSSTNCTSVDSPF